MLWARAQGDFLHFWGSGSQVPSPSRTCWRNAWWAGMWEETLPSKALPRLTCVSLPMRPGAAPWHRVGDGPQRTTKEGCVLEQVPYPLRPLHPIKWAPRCCPPIVGQLLVIITCTEKQKPPMQSPHGSGYAREVGLWPVCPSVSLEADSPYLPVCMRGPHQSLHRPSDKPFTINDQYLVLLSYE